MNVRKRLKFVTAMLAITIVLSGCTTNNVDNDAVNSTPPAPAASVEQPTAKEDDQEEVKPAAEPAPAEPQQGETPADQPVPAVDPSQLPATKELEFLLEGMTEKVSSTLKLSEQGYGFYLMEGFEYTMEEPGKDMIFSEAHPDYFARVQLLPADSNVEEIKAFMKEQLQATGEVLELTGEDIHSMVREQASFFMQSSGSDFTQNAMLLNADGALFLTTIHLPNGEAMEGISERFYPMLQTLVAVKQ